MRENFKMTNIMGLAFWKNKVNNIKEPLRKAINMVLEFRDSKMEICIKVNMKKEIFMERESIYGQMETYLKENLFKESDLVQVNGCLLNKMETFITVVTRTI